MGENAPKIISYRKNKNKITLLYFIKKTLYNYLYFYQDRENRYFHPKNPIILLMILLKCYTFATYHYFILGYNDFINEFVLSMSLLDNNETLINFEIIIFDFSISSPDKLANH